MIKHRLRYLLFIFIALDLSACISVQLPSGSAAPAKDVTYNAPAKPFQEIKVASADKAWLSKTTGNTISFISDCRGSIDPSLEQIENESLAVLEKLKIVHSKSLNYNGRDARRTQAMGEMDGVQVKTELIIFKKNGCNFTLSYGGVAKSFETEISQFETFLEGFKAP